MTTAEIVVADGFQPCSYLPGRVARLPYRHPVRQLTPDEFDERLAAGDRRTGLLLYRTLCPKCQSCEPIRLDLATFHANATQRREKRRGDSILTVRIAPPTLDSQRIRLFNLHRHIRDLDRDDSAIDREGYDGFLVQSCVQTWELSYWHEDRLVAVAIVDAGRMSLSAVYCFYDPNFTAVSLGTYSVLREVQLCRETGRQYLYLGFFVRESPHMSYKARFHPHQRLVSGEWRDFE